LHLCFSKQLSIQKNQNESDQYSKEEPNPEKPDDPNPEEEPVQIQKNRIQIL
jgi:hypothetical protein